MKRLLTNSEFEQAIRKLPRALKKSNVSIARAILVEGQKQADIIQETGLSRSAISSVVRKIRRSHEVHGKPPEGWERIEICLPIPMIKMVRALEEEARRQNQQEDF